MKGRDNIFAGGLWSSLSLLPVMAEVKAPDLSRSQGKIESTIHQSSLSEQGTGFEAALPHPLH